MRVLFELDQLDKKLNRSPQERLARLEKYPDLVARRDDLMIEYITLLNIHGRYDDAYAALMGRNFHPWEGGEGKTTGQYVTSLIGQAQTLIRSGRYEDAIERLERRRAYPPNLGEGKLPNAQENYIFYFLAVAHEGLGDAGMAGGFYEKASLGLSEPTSPLYYNDQPPDTIFCQGVARASRGRRAAAGEIFRRS